MPNQVVDNVHEAIRWATDYLLKASAQLPHALYVQVGLELLIWLSYWTLTQ